MIKRCVMLLAGFFIIMLYASCANNAVSANLLYYGGHENAAVPSESASESEKIQTETQTEAKTGTLTENPAGIPTENPTESPAENKPAESEPTANGAGQPPQEYPFPEIKAPGAPGVITKTIDENGGGIFVSVAYPETGNAAIDDFLCGVARKRADEFGFIAKETGGAFYGRYTCGLYENRLLSVVYSFTGYAGGSPFSYEEPYVFDAATGALVTLGDLFSASRSDYINIICDFFENGGVYNAAANIIGGEQPFIRFSVDGGGLYLYGSADEAVIPLDAFGPDVIHSYVVSQERKEKIADPGKKYIALTFDDGPSEKYTQVILDALNEYGAKATFFALGLSAEKYGGELALCAEAGDEIGNHSYHHVDFSGAGKSVISGEIDSTNDLVKSLTGESPILLRPPYGDRNDAVVKAAKDRGMAVILWDIDPQDWLYKDADRTAKWIVSRAKDGDIVLMHDIYKTSADAAVNVIKQLTDMGFTLVTVSDLIEIETGGLTAGGVYRNAFGSD